MKRSIQTTIVSNDLSDAIQEEMWEVYRHYYHYSKEYFMARISKNNYYSFYRSNGTIVGFTGLRINRTRINGKRQFLVYFGQTVIEEQYRGMSLIPMTGAKLCLKYWKDILWSEVFFWADALTYKAYLVFAKTVPEMYPSYKQAMPTTVEQVRNHIGEMHYADTFCKETGTIRKDTVWVNDTTLTIPARYRLDPDIRFYTEANPKSQDGHGLLTMAPMHAKNIFCLTLRTLKRSIGIKRISLRQKARAVSHTTLA